MSYLGYGNYFYTLYVHELPDGSNPQEKKRSFDKQEDWKQAILDNLQQSTVVVKWRVYACQLADLQVPEKVMHCDWIGLWCKHLRHEFITLQLEEKNGSGQNKCWLTLERNLSGINAQIFTNEADVEKLNKETVNRSKVKLVKVDDETSIRAILSHDELTVDNLLKDWDVQTTYFIVRQDCQSLVADGDKRRQIIEKSKQLKFHLPGGGGATLTIDDPRIKEHLKKMYPTLTKNDANDVVMIPQLEEPFAIYAEGNAFSVNTRDTVFSKNTEEEDENEEDENEAYKILQYEQKIYGSFAEAIKNMKLKNGNWKVLFSNLSAQRVRKATDLVEVSKEEDEEEEEEVSKAEVSKEKEEEEVSKGKVSIGQATRISQFWSHAFDILFMTPELGCILVQFKSPHGQNKTDEKSLKDRAQMLVELGEIKEESIHSIIIDWSNQNHEADAKTSMPHTLSIDKDAKPEKMIECITTCLKQIQKDSNSANDRDEINTLIARIFVLNRLEEDNILLHNKIVNQEWGHGKAVAMFTENQFEAIQLGRIAFRDSKPLHLAVQGPAGSGKTLLLMQFIRDFVRLTSHEKLVYIRSHQVRSDLANDLKKFVKTDPELQKRVVVGIKWEGEWRERHLILLDEVNMFEGKFQADKFLMKVLKDTSPTQSLILCSSDDNVTADAVNAAFHKQGKEFHFISMKLTTTLRATQLISQFIEDFRSPYPTDALSLKSGVAVKGKWPAVHYIEDYSEDRREMINECVSLLRGWEEREGKKEA